VEGGGWRVEGGRWRVEGGGRRVEGGGWHVKNWEDIWEAVIFAQFSTFKSFIMGQFKNLRVWQDSMGLAEKIYVITKGSDAFSRDYGLKDQIRRAVVSIPSNIAEGDERDSNRLAVHFFNISKGSAAEVMTQLNLAHRIGYIDQSTFETLEQEADIIRASLKNLIKARGGDDPGKMLFWAILSIFKPL
jgi:four helix bundle protein